MTLEWSLRHLPLGLYLVVLGFWSLMTVLWALMLTGERLKSLFRESYANGILWPPFAYSLLHLTASACVFASLSMVLAQHGLVRYEPPLPADLAPVVNLYTWHFLDSIPGLDVPQTLRWDEPYRYADRLPGVVLLAFKLLVIVPVIGSFAVWSSIRESAVAAKAKAERDQAKRAAAAHRA